MIVMYLIFFLIWVIFNGKLNLEITLFGLVIAGLMYCFLVKFLDYKPSTDKLLAKRGLFILYYCLVLFKEIILANVAVLKKLVTERYDVEPIMVEFDAPLQSKFARVLLANSITLTPGTITVSLKENHLQVHCLDKEFGVGIDQSIFVRLLQQMEEIQ